MRIPNQNSSVYRAAVREIAGRSRQSPSTGQRPALQRTDAFDPAPAPGSGTLTKPAPRTRPALPPDAGEFP